MKHAAIALSLLLVPAIANAQGYYPYPSAPPPPPPPAQPTAPASSVQTSNLLGIGVRVAGMSVTSQADPNQEVSLSGVGLQARYRFSPAWSLELTLEGLNNEKADNFDIFQRRTSSGVLAIRYHFSPASEWDWYALLGLGAADDEITFVDSNGTTQIQKFGESQVRLGGGVEYRFSPSLGVGIEGHLVGLARDDQQGDGPLYVGIDGGPVPAQSSGGEANLTVTLYL